MSDEDEDSDEGVGDGEGEGQGEGSDSDNSEDAALDAEIEAQLAASEGRPCASGCVASWLLESAESKSTDDAACGNVRVPRRWFVEPDGCVELSGSRVCSDEAEDEAEDDEEEVDTEDEKEGRTKARGGVTAQSSDSEGEDAVGGIQSTFVRHLEHELTAAQVR